MVARSGTEIEAQTTQEKEFPTQSTKNNTHMHEQSAAEPMETHTVSPTASPIRTIHKDKRDHSQIKERSNIQRQTSDAESIEDEQHNNHSVKEMQEALDIQLRKYGRYHNCITRSLHALALEYKKQGRFDKAKSFLKEAQDILDERLEMMIAEVIQDIEEDQEQDTLDLHSGSSKFVLVKDYASNVTKRYFSHLMEEKSALYSCQANIYRKRKMFKEAMDYYVKSINMLVEADYPGDSPRVAMLVRIMKRTDTERKSLEKRRTIFPTTT
ncbi:predicted protein [Chaetoceros tenuissimus]|uniref:Uncharacterized protein n=1 Tax=Chaetoceros tenuissimus TaxID=426638 RepID=A0AAD3CJG4_9STRA|nr:predicted protein [Chaetoceros tenuissimus]